MNEEEFQQRLQLIREDITRACVRACRKLEDVELMGVTKKVSLETIMIACRAGLTLFGENKVQEGKLKVQDAPSLSRWHMIGHLQSNKVRDAVSFFSMIHSVDTVTLAQDINKWSERLGRRPQVLIEVNTSGEASKYGVSPAEVEALAVMINSMPRLELCGLMTMAPYCEDSERARPYFARLREIRDTLNQRLGFGLPVLSMGMSGDFPVAVEEGATLIRIGTRLFGERTY